MSTGTPWVSPPSGRNAQTFDSPTFTGTHTGDTWPLSQSWTAVSCPADTTEDALQTLTIPANTLRANDSLRLTTYWAFTNGAGTKTLRVRFGSLAAGAQYYNTVFTTQTPVAVVTTIANANSTSSQTGWSQGIAFNGGTPSISMGFNTSSLDTTASQTIVVSGQKNTSGDTLTLTGYSLEVIRA